MPFGYNHPARVAERAAMLDIISNGRLNLGAARGATMQEMALCGVDPETTTAQVKEALRFIGHCWRGDSIEWDSDLLQIRHPARSSQPHGRAAAKCSSICTALPGLQPRRDRAHGGRVRRGADDPGLRRSRGGGPDAGLLRRGPGGPRPRRHRVPGQPQRRIRGPVPLVPDGRRREGPARRRPRPAVLRRVDHPLGRAERSAADARHRRGRQRRVHAGGVYAGRAGRGRPRARRPPRRPCCTASTTPSATRRRLSTT